ncbi:MAG: CotH kinase family protein [Clostridia bacterium]|nr:CotH kinase family protein [Clostridia bacterium]
MKKRLVSLALALIMIVGLMPTLAMPAEAATAPTNLRLEPTETNGIPAQIDVFKARVQTGGTSWNPSYSEIYQIYLPGNVNATNCFLSWDGDAKATVDNKTYPSGECPVPELNTETTYTFTDGTSLQVIAYQGSAKVTPVFIIVDESDGKPTIAQMDGDPDHEVTCSGTIFIDGKEYGMSKIKGRGNYTWKMSQDKRAYNITLDEKIQFPGLVSIATKKWSILSEIGDHSLLCNRSGFYLANKMGIGQDTASVDVWMNGEYQGCYTITPKYDSFVAKNGYLIENDNYRETLSVAEGGDPQFELEGLEAGGYHIDSSTSTDSKFNAITIKKIGDNLLMKDGVIDESPENVEAVAASIQAWLQDAWNAIKSDDGYNSKGKYYTEYIDIESFAKMYLLQDYVKSYDVCAGSIFFHRDGNMNSDKLIAGPLWDLDNAMGSTQSNNSLGSVGDRRSGEGAFMTEIVEYKTSIYKTLYKHQDFKNEVRRQYNIYSDTFNRLEGVLADMISDIRDSAKMNHIKVNDISGYNLHKYSRATQLGSGVYLQNMLATTDSKTDWDAYAANLKTYVHTRTLWFADNYVDSNFVDPASCEHDYEVVETIDASCTSTGLITSVCSLCGDRKAEVIPITHNYVDGVCTICGAKMFNVTFSCAPGASVTVYEHKNFEGEHEDDCTVVHPRNGDTGEIDYSGDGQVNFVVNLDPCYELTKVDATGSYRNLKNPSETGVTNGYRLTKVTGDVTINVETAIAHDWSGWTITTVPTSATPGEKTRTCSRCGKVETGPLQATGLSDSFAQVLGHTLTLKGEIGVNTYLLFGDAVLDAKENYQVEFWKNGELISVTTADEIIPVIKAKGGNDYAAYGLTVKTVAKEMGTDFTMKIKQIDTGAYVDFVNSDGTTIVGADGLDYCINDYLEDRITNSDNDNMVQLAKDMRNYGVYAKHYFAVQSGETEVLPEVEGFIQVTTEDLSDYQYSTPQNIDHFTYKGTTLLLKEETSFRMYFESDQIDSLTIMIGDTVLPKEAGKGQYAGMYYVEIQNISAKYLDVMYDFTISNGLEETTAHHGPFGYVYWALTTDGKTDLKYAMMALYHYNQAAKAYFN